LKCRRQITETRTCLGENDRNVTIDTETNSDKCQDVDIAEVLIIGIEPVSERASIFWVRKKMGDVLRDEWSL
jgi:hypothetical protein